MNFVECAWFLISFHNFFLELHKNTVFKLIAFSVHSDVFYRLFFLRNKGVYWKIIFVVFNLSDIWIFEVEPFVLSAVSSRNIMLEI